MLKNIRNLLFVYRKIVFARANYSDDVRVRFAPSPTGFLHLGGLRTALYNSLFAKSKNGTFILRIEDTDQTRLVEGAREQLERDLLWAGIEIHEGPSVGGNFGPYVQSERRSIYNEQVKTLLENGSAYHCFCSDKRLNLLRREAMRMRQVPKYDNRCRHLSKEEVDKKLRNNESYCIRFKLLPDCETFEDMIYGNIAYDVALNEGDPVIIKSDRYPTYHFANVVDDHFMKISHVLRGVEWQISTTKHILMYRAFNWEPPVYGHLPLLMNPDGTKLSKRQGDIQISHYRDNGIFPEAVVNFITNSGGGFEKDQERGLKPKCYTIDELSDQFDIEKINSHSGRLMPERLLEFNRLALQRKLENKEDTDILIKEIQKLVQEKFSELRTVDQTESKESSLKGSSSIKPKESSSESVLQLDDDYVRMILQWSSNRINKLGDLVSKDLAFVWTFSGIKQDSSKEEVKVIESLRKVLEEQEFEKEKLNAFLKTFAKECKFPFKKLMKTLRTVLSGLKEGPSVAEMLEILGKKNAVERLEMFLKNNR